MPFQSAPVQNFIGNGLIFPIALTNGKPPISTGFDLIRASITNILSFHLGNRFFLGEFGSQLDDLIEEPNDEVLQNTIKTFVVGAITTWEKRVKNISIELISNGVEQLSLSITYQVVNTNTTDNFIFPFYKEIIY
jgi:Bacteriophage baseplate protein W